MENEAFFWCVTEVVMTYQANKLEKFRLIREKRPVISMLPFTAEIKKKFLSYKVANNNYYWTPHPKPIKEALAILKSPLKLLIISSYNGQQFVFPEN